MGQDEPRAVFEQPRCGLGQRGLDVAFFLSLPLGGLIAYRYLVSTGRLRHQLRFGALLLTRAQEARRLLAERREIVEEFALAKRDYLGRRERTERLK
jgi:hypothetical protein